MTDDRLPPVHPGEILAEDVMADLGLSIREVARELGVSPNRISQIVRGERSITADTALRLSQWLGTTPDLWLNIQQRYDLEIALRDLGEKIRSEVKPRAAVLT